MATHVLKRDGQTVRFNLTRIATAIYKAMEAVDQIDHGLVYCCATKSLERPGALVLEIRIINQLPQRNERFHSLISLGL